MNTNEKAPDCCPFCGGTDGIERRVYSETTVERLTRDRDEARGRVKRLEGESESRWLLAQSAIGSCAEMSSRIKRLEEALEACAAIIGPRDKVTWATDEQVDHAWELYTKAKEAKP